MSVRATLPDLDRIARDGKGRLEELTMRAESEMRAYVPLREGHLRDSAKLASRFEAGLIVWMTPYAPSQYYLPMRHENPRAPLATDHWDEAWRRDRWDAFMDYARRMYAR